MEEKIRLTDICEPVLKEGRYEIEVIENADVGEKISFTEKTDIVVSSRRFRLQPDEIYSVYPPIDSSGEYGGCIPHVIFNRDTIPWEREMFQGKAEKSCPWMMLLLLTDGEGCWKQEMTIAEALEGCKNPLIYMGKDPDMPADGMEKNTDSCAVVDISAQLAASVLPDWEEVKLLAHGRLVSLEDKVTDAAVRSGWFSCLAANRYVGEGTQEPEHYQACLVSLKGFEELLEADSIEKKQQCMAGAVMVRFFVLYEWGFNSTASPYSFPGMIRRLKAGTLCSQVKEEVQTQALRDLLERGYYPLNHRLRDGSRTVSWYRGPFVPQYEKQEPFHYHVFSDQISKYDPDIGMLDMSYACAWQLGRMLAFQNQSYCKVFIHWRFENYRRAAGYRQEEQIKQFIGNAETVNEVQTKGLDDILTKQCIKIMSGQPSDAKGDRLAFPADSISDKVPKETFFQCMKKEEHTQFPEAVKDFIMECSLLYHVPFWYLLPDPDMLKEEELRFFWIDTDWLMHFMDGMCSIARNASIDYQHDEALLNDLFAQVMKENDAVRRKKQGKENDEPAECIKEGRHQKYTGFLLRSALVKDYRGLEFQAYDAREGGNRLQALRLDTMGANVLIGIFRGEIRRLEIGQPPEGLHFGMDLTDTEKGKTAVKYLRNLHDGVQNGREVKIPFKQEGRFRCMDVKQMKEIIARELGKEIQSAGLALEMIQNAHTGVFQISDQSCV